MFKQAILRDLLCSVIFFRSVQYLDCFVELCLQIWYGCWLKKANCWTVKLQWARQKSLSCSISRQQMLKSLIVAYVLRVLAVVTVFCKIWGEFKPKQVDKCLIIKRLRANSYLNFLSSKLKIKSRYRWCYLRTKPKRNIANHHYSSLWRRVNPKCTHFIWTYFGCPGSTVLQCYRRVFLPNFSYWVSLLSAFLKYLETAV